MILEAPVHALRLEAITAGVGLEDPLFMPLRPLPLPPGANQSRSLETQRLCLTGRLVARD